MKLLKIFLPFLVIAAGIGGAFIMIKSRPPVQTKPRKILDPIVRAILVKKQTEKLAVFSYGTVQPRTRINLIPQVTGEITHVSSSFINGGFFKANDILVQIDKTDYELALVRAKAQVDQALVRFEREKVESEIAKEEWKKYGQGDPGPLATRKLQYDEAKAALDAAKSVEKQADVNLKRTVIRAPFAGRVSKKFVDIHQVVTVGMPIAEIYSIDFAEIRLPVPDDQLQFLSISFDQLGNGIINGGPTVTLSANLGKKVEWSGKIVRTEAEIDQRTRMIYLVAWVEDPYGVNGNNRIPMLAGMFVEAKIEGKEIQDAIVIPRTSMRDDSNVLVIDNENKLRLRKVSVVKLETVNAIIKGGLAEGDFVCTSHMETAVDGAKVRVQKEEPK